MNNDSDYRSQMEQSNGYEIVEAIDPIAAATDEIISTYIEQIALVAITLRFESEMSVICCFLEDLRSLVRKTDRVFLLENTMYFLLPGANLQGGKIVQSRLWEALLWHINTIPNAETTQWRNLISRNSCSITIGHSAYPIPCTDINEFIRAANAAVLHFERQPKPSEAPKRRKGRSDMELSEKEHKGPRSGQQTSLLELENVDEELPVLARKLGIPYLSLLPSKLPADIKQLVDPKLAHELHCYPLGRERNMLTVAMLNPQDRSALDRLHQETGLHIFPVLIHPQALQRALEQLIC